jgi:nucleoside-diphosphate-sugar epimerase
VRAHAPTVLVTGATGYVGGDVLRRMLERDRAMRAYALVRDPGRWPVTAARLGAGAARVTPLRGDVAHPGLGLDATDRRRLAEEGSAVVHLAADTTFSRQLEEARRTNLDGMRHLLDLTAGWRHLDRVAHVSTAFVAGRRAGTVCEEEASASAGWVNGYEQSKHEAEALLRSSGIDWVIFRPSTLVCDSTAGAVSQVNAVHQALRVYHRGLAAMMPGTDSSAVDVVPLDYVADAIARLALADDLRGATLHLCAGRGALPLGDLLDATYAVWAADASWKRCGIPRPALTDLATYRLFERSIEETGDERLRRVVRSLSHFVPQLAAPKTFDTAVAERALGHRAPPVACYWTRMVASLAATWASSGRVAA